MRYRLLGSSGLRVSEFALGTMTFGNQCDEPTSRAIMDKAFELGVTFFDTADAYPLGSTSETLGRTEEYIGRWLKGKRWKQLQRLAYPLALAAVLHTLGFQYLNLRGPILSGCVFGIILLVFICQGSGIALHHSRQRRRA